MLFYLFLFVCIYVCCLVILDRFVCLWLVGWLFVPFAWFVCIGLFVCLFCYMFVRVID